MAKYKVFYGKRYSLRNENFTREQAKKVESRLRKQLYGVHIEKVSRGNYNIWTSPV